ncbi:MAG: PAS domain-containing protein [Bacteroidales bacterium]|nr:PAS domain-containing protein [Bacteroidales bacterium]
MATQKKLSKEMQLLRKQAEAELKIKETQLPDLSVEQIRNLVHELYTHQVELEMQNEELRLAQEKLAEEHEKYISLYDFAPVGYFTMNEEGMIEEVNLTGAALLGVERRNLHKKPLSNFILSDDQDIYYRHRQKLIETEQPQSCELRIKKRGRSVFWALITCVMVNQNQTEGEIRFNMTMTDVTEKKKEEEVLKNTVHELNQFNRFMVDRETRMIELKKRINELQKRLGEAPEFPE